MVRPTIVYTQQMLQLHNVGMDKEILKCPVDLGQLGTIIGDKIDLVTFLPIVINMVCIACKQFAVS